MDTGQFLGEDFIAAVVLAGARARLQTLEDGVPVFYWDSVRNLDIMEMPDGQKYEIRFLPGAPGERNYELIRLLNEITS